MVRHLIILLIAAIPWAACIPGEIEKESKRAICHDEGSPHHAKTKHFRPLADLESCLNSGGRSPANHQDYSLTTTATPILPQKSSKYDRSQFGGWSDEDGDCLNTRHELLMKLSTSTIEMGRNACMISRGRWNDPYTGKIFYEARDVDIDHLVPLKWAWEHGADRWSFDKRKAFANDEANLFAVEASVNRQKGAMGALEWLPPNKEFHCQYTLRFTRITKEYDFSLSVKEDEALNSLRETVCRMAS